MKILLIRLSSIGDILLTTPVVRALYRAIPEASIHFVTRIRYTSLLEHHPHIHTIHGYSSSGPDKARLRQVLREEKFDLVIDLHAVPRSRALRRGLAHRVHVYQKQSWRWLALVGLKWNLYRSVLPIPERYLAAVPDLGLKADQEGLELYLPPTLSELVLQMLIERGWDGRTPIIALCPGARHATKRWPEQHHADLLRRIREHSHSTVVLLGGPEDTAILRDPGEGVIDLRGRLTLLETAAVMDACTVVVTNDSGLMHMATARRRPVVALFGSTVREFGFYPYQADATVLEIPGLPCRPCTHIGRARCPQGHFRCMEDLQPAHVWSAILSRLS